MNVKDFINKNVFKSTLINILEELERQRNSIKCQNDLNTKIDNIIKSKISDYKVSKAITAFSAKNYTTIFEEGEILNNENNLEKYFQRISYKILKGHTACRAYFEGEELIINIGI